MKVSVEKKLEKWLQIRQLSSSPRVNFHHLEQVLGVSGYPPAEHTPQPGKILLFLIARAALCQVVQQQSPAAAVQGPCARREEQENSRRLLAARIRAWK